MIVENQEILKTFFSGNNTNVRENLQMSILRRLAENMDCVKVRKQEKLMRNLLEGLTEDLQDTSSMLIITKDTITKEKKLYFGVAAGNSEREDTNYILRMGTKIDKTILEFLLNLLKEENVK